MGRVYHERESRLLTQVATSASSTLPLKAYKPKISAKQLLGEFNGRILREINDSARGALFC